MGFSSLVTIDAASCWVSLASTVKVIPSECRGRPVPDCLNSGGDRLLRMRVSCCHPASRCLQPNASARRLRGGRDIGCRCSHLVGTSHRSSIGECAGHVHVRMTPRLGRRARQTVQAYPPWTVVGPGGDRWPKRHRSPHCGRSRAGAARTVSADCLPQIDGVELRTMTEETHANHATQHVR
jgi:hypothetical protein